MAESKGKPNQLPGHMDKPAPRKAGDGHNGSEKMSKAGGKNDMGKFPMPTTPGVNR